MTEAVWLALIAMVGKGWADTVALMTSPTGVSIVGFLIVLAKQWWDARHAKAAAAAAKASLEAANGTALAIADAQVMALESGVKLAAKIDHNTKVTESVKDAAVRSRGELTDAFMAGERTGYVGGIAEGRKQATGPMPLGNSDGSDPNDKR